LTFCCYRRYPFLKADRTCQWLGEAIDSARERLEFDLWAFVFMPEHVHLIVHPRALTYDISMILRDLKQPVSRHAVAYLKGHAPEWLPRLAVRKGNAVRHQFWKKGGGFDRNLVEPESLVAMIDYIHQNPVRRGLVERAWEFWWSSAAWHMGISEAPLRVDPIPPEWLPVA
jgi:putative transposase